MFREILEFNPVYYNEVTYYLEMKWDRKLNDHEKHLY